MLDKLKQFLTGERIETHVYDENTLITAVLQDLQSKTPKGKELTEIEFFDNQGDRVQHWKKYK